MAPFDPIEERTRRFYDFEKRGRGTSLYPSPVFLEPPFRPFVHAPVSSGMVDDGRRHTVFSWLADFARRPWKALAPAPSLEGCNDPKPDIGGERTELRLYLPRDFRPGKDAADGFLRSLSVVEHPVSWELEAEAGKIRYFLSLRPRDRQAVEAAAAAFFPGVNLLENPSSCLGWEGSSFLGLEFALAHEFVVPLKASVQPDPLLPLLSLFSQMETGEKACLQVLFIPARRPWRESILRAVHTPAGAPFFENAPHVSKAAEEKVSAPLFAACVRLGVSAPSRERLYELARLAAGILGGLGRENRLLPLSDNPHIQGDITLRRSHRAGMLLSLPELALLVHLPGADIELSGIERGTRKEKAPPAESLSGGVFLGEVSWKGKREKVFLPEEARLRHTLLLGATGSGKTTALLHLILEDINASRGVGLIDPHGDLGIEVISRIPEERLKDLVLLDPSDPEVSSGWNALEARSDTEREVLSSDLVALMKRYSTSFGDQMVTTLSNAVAALLSMPGTYTLSDLRRFLVDKKWRESLVGEIEDRETQFFWAKEFTYIGERSLGPILGRLNTFLRSRPVRESVSRPHGIDFRALLDGQGILIARLPLGTLGEENVAVVGSLLLSKIHQSALSRADLRPEERRPFHLYADEVQLFLTPSVSQILSGGRKFGLSLLAATQSLASLHSQSPEIEASLLANAYTRLLFRIGSEDEARKLERGLSTFDAADLLNLKTGRAVCRLGERQNDFLVEIPEPAKLSAEEERTARERARACLSERNPKSPPETVPDEDAPEALALPPVLPRREEPRKTKERAKPAAPPPIGRGGHEHRYYQELAKLWGEAQGFRVTVEQPVLDGRGSVDVAFERDGWRLACEISVTSTVEHEVGNTLKCLKAGFDEVVVISPKKEQLTKLERALGKKLEAEDLSRVKLLLPEEFQSYLEALSVGRERVETVGGYEVKVKYRPPSKDEREKRMNAVADVIARSLRRKQGR